VSLDVIRPGNPVKNAVMESLNGRLRDECLNGHQFTSLAEAQAIIEAWRMDYHHHSPHRALGHLPLHACSGQRQAKQIAEEALGSS
jgi:putative transposase